MKKAFILCACFSLAFLGWTNPAHAQLADAPWPMFHGGLKSTGLSSYDTSRVNGSIEWTLDLGAQVETSPAIGSDGTIYLSDQDCYVHAINPDGTEKWKFDVGDPVSSKEWGFTSCAQSSPTVGADGTIYSLPMTGNLFAINADGTEKWRYPIFMFKNAWSSPAIGSDGTIYVGSESYPPRETGQPEEQPAYFYALNADGTLKWRYNTRSSWVNGTPSIADDGTIYTSGGYCEQSCVNVVYAFNPDGKTKWIFKPPNGVMEGSVTIGSDGTLYFGAKGADDPRNANYYALNPDGSIKWKFPMNAGTSVSPGIDADGNLYFGDWNGVFYSLDQNGQERWRVETPKAYEALSSSPAIGAEGTIYFGTIANTFYAYNLDGTKKWELPLANSVVSSPAIGADGTVYFTTVNGTLFALSNTGRVSLSTVTDSRPQRTTNIEMYVMIGMAFLALIAICFGAVIRKRRRLLWIVAGILVVGCGLMAIGVFLPRGQSTNTSAVNTAVTNTNVTTNNDPCPHHVYGTAANGFYGAFGMTTRDLTDTDVIWIQNNCPNTTWPEAMRK